MAIVGRQSKGTGLAEIGLEVGAYGVGLCKGA
jgi:hypothetical protein